MIKTTITCDKCGKEEQLPIDVEWRNIWLTIPEYRNTKFRSIPIYGIYSRQNRINYEFVPLGIKILCESCSKEYDDLLYQGQIKINRAIFDFWGNDNLNKLLVCPES